MKFKFRPDEHLIGDALFFHVLHGAQTYISRVLVKRPVLLADDAYVAAHGQGRYLHERVDDRGGWIRDEYHVALLHRSVAIVGAVESDTVGKDILVEPLHRNGDMTPPSIQVCHLKINHADTLLRAHFS